MLSKTIKTIRTERWFYTLVFIHILAWTLVPWCVRYTLPMDSMEGATWGHQLQWGYDKNPFMNGWLTALAVKISGQSGWAIYLFSQLSVAVCFWAIWKLSKKMLPPLYALVAVLLLEGIQYYNLHAIDFNDNTLELGLWALTALFFYQALVNQSIRNWVLTGLFAGLGMMTKYYTVMLLFPMALFMLINPHARESFKKPHTYFGLLIFLIVITPHTIWLLSQNFVTLNYAIHRVSAPPTWMHHIFFPVQFTYQLFETLIPSLVILSVLFIGKKPTFAEPKIQLTRFDKEFLFYVGLGPLLLTVLLSAFTGIKLRAGWGQPLLSLSGIMLIATLNPHLTAGRFYRFIAILLSFLSAVIVGYSISLMRPDSASSSIFPGKEIAQVITTEWYQTYHKPITYVAGPRWIAGNIAFYSKDHPAVYIEWNKKLSPWIDEIKLQREGAIFVWDFTTEDTQPSFAEISARFTRLGKPNKMHFAWLRNKDLTPIEIMVAFLPPQPV